MSRNRTATRVTVLAIALMGPATLHAGGFAVARFGGEKGNPVASNPTSVYYNPAALAGIGGTQIYLEGLLAFRSLDYIRDPRAIDGTGRSPEYVSANSGKAELNNVIPAPFLGVATNLGVEGLGLGAAFYVPFGAHEIWDKRDAFEGNASFPGAVDGPQRWQDIEGTLRSLYFSVGGAYKLPFGLSIGVTVSLVRSETDDIKAFNVDGTDQIAGEGRAWVKAHGTDFALGVGVTYSPPAYPELTIGFSYQSQPGFGKQTQSGDARIKIGTADELTPRVEVEQSLPDVYRLGLSYQVSKNFAVSFWGGFERWSVFKSQCFVNKDLPDRNCAIDDRGQTTPEAVVISNIPRNWNDVFNFRGSASYWVIPQLELMLGFGYDSNAVPDETLLMDLVDFDDWEITIAAQYALTKHIKTYLGFSQFFYMGRDVAPEPRDENGQRTTYLPPSRQAGNAGRYDEAISLLTLGLSYTF